MTVFELLIDLISAAFSLQSKRSFNWIHFPINSPKIMIFMIYSE